MLRLSCPTFSEETQDSGGAGERILTTKSARELAKLVSRLNRQLQAKDAEIRILKLHRDESLPTSPEQLRQNAQRIQQELMSAETQMDQLQNNRVEQFYSQMSLEHDEENPRHPEPCYDNSNETGIPTDRPTHQTEVSNARRDSFGEDDVSSLSFQPGSPEHFKAAFRTKQMVRKDGSARHSMFHIPSGTPMMESEGTLQTLSSSKGSGSSRTVTPSRRSLSARESRHDEGGLKTISSGSSEDEELENKQTEECNHHSAALVSVGTW